MITSLNNDRVKQVVALQSRRRERHKAGRFVIEGTRLCYEAVLADVPIDEVYYTEEFAADREGMQLLEGLSESGAMLVSVDDTVMGALSDTPSPQGILAVLPFLELAPGEHSFALIIDAVSDPGNLGTIMRAAVAAGVKLMITTSGTVDVVNPKVVRAAMGAHFRLPVQHLSWEGIADELQGHVIFLASTEGGGIYHEVDWTQPCALIVSDEAHGASEGAVRTAHAHVTIPMPGSMESLNVAMATSIILFEMVRQRRKSASTGAD